MSKFYAILMVLGILAAVVVTLYATGGFAGAKSVVPVGNTTNPTSPGTVAQYGGPIASMMALRSVPGLVAPAGVSQQFLETVKYPDYSHNPIQYTAVSGQTINCYSQWPSPSTSTTTTATSASSAVAVTNIQPGITYLCYAGDNSNSGYFKNYTYQNIGLSNNYPVTIVTPKYSAPVAKFSNSSSTANEKSSQSVLHDVTPGVGTQYTVYFDLKATTYTSCEQSCAVSVSANNLAIGSIYVNGQSPQNLNVPAMSFQTSNSAAPSLIGYVGSQNQQWNYLVSGISASNYSTGAAPISSGQATSNGQGQSRTDVLIPVQINTLSAIAGNEIISYCVTPSTDEFNQSDGAMQVGVFKNPNSQAQEFAPVCTNAAWILQTN